MGGAVGVKKLLFLHIWELRIIIMTLTEKNQILYIKAPEKRYNA